MSRKDRALSPAEKMDARAALKLLDGTGTTLEQLARQYAGSTERSVQTEIGAAVDLFLKDCLRRDLRPSSFRDYEQKLYSFAIDKEGKSLDDFKRPEVREWIEGLKVADSTRQAYLRALRVLFRWARRQDPPLVGMDATEGLTIAKKRQERIIELLTVSEAQKVMESAGEYGAMLALMLFAGVRPSEIHSRDKPPLTWASVNFKEKYVRIPAECSKTRSARVLEGLPSNLWAWLKAAKATASEPIAPGRSRQATRLGRQAIGHWPQDVCRHSFASYHVALLSDVSRTSLILGHEGKLTMLHQHYRGIATKAEAQKFFKIVPS